MFSICVTILRLTSDSVVISDLIYEYFMLCRNVCKPNHYDKKFAILERKLLEK